MKKAILLVAFGASTPHGRSALAGFEALCRKRFPAIPVRWAYTSMILRERLALQKQKNDSVAKALSRLRFENYSSIAIQPLQTIAGREYEEVCCTASLFQEQTGISCVIGRPLLSGDTGAAAAALLSGLPAQRGPGEEVIFMGHGARHAAESMYTSLGCHMTEMDPRVFIGTMSGALALDKLLPLLSSGPVWLLPLLSTVGQHALRDMAGPGPDSWRARIEAAGYACRPVLSGMVENPSLANIWLSHLENAISSPGR